MSTSSSRNPSRRTSKSGPSSNAGKDGTAQKSSNSGSGDRRSKAKSAQIDTGRRRASQQTDSAGNVIDGDQPGLKSRINSAPLAHRLAADAGAGATDGATKEEKEHETSDEAESYTTADGGFADAQDEDEVAGVVGTVKHFEHFKPPALSEPLPDINIAVIGSRRVGKSTFMQKALDVPLSADSRVLERKIGIDGTDYILRLLEIPIDDIDVEDDEEGGALVWPVNIEDKIMPQVDGAVTLYDVGDKGSLEGVGRLLNAIHRDGVPSLLVSTKCDLPEEKQQVDFKGINQLARRRIKNLDTLYVGKDIPGSHQEGISFILRAIVSNVPSEELKLPSVARKRAQSNIVRSVSPRPPSDRGHVRAASEYTGSIYKEKTHLRHDSSLATYNTVDRLKTHHEAPQDGMQGSFLIEESDGSEISEDTLAQDEDSIIASTVFVPTSTLASEDGVTFEQLVSRLLAQPTSKADNKFAAVFLALYRKFAAPGELLEAIASHFGEIDESSNADITKTSNQLRILAIVQLWTSTYPGDFAYPKTKRRIRTLVNKLSETRVFAAAAKEIGSDLDATRVDDDTNWACSDKDRAPSMTALPSAATTLIDDPAYMLADDFAPRNWANDNSTVVVESEISRTTSSQSSQIIANIELAQQQATLLQPIPRQPVTKVQWRQLLDFPDETIARELTRMDWIMFCSIRPRDLVRQVSLSKAEKAGCRNVTHVNRIIDHFNQLAFWVENYVLLRDKPKHRALMLEKFMRVARKLREMNNYNALGAIIAGIKSSSVHRLAATRELIPPAVGRDWMKLEILMAPSKSYSAYRLAWENSSGERIPYLPLHRRDIVSAEEGNKTFVGEEKEGRINWKKFEIIGEVVVSMQKAQGVAYRGLGGGRGNEGIRDLVLDGKFVKDEDELFERSKLVEPPGTSAIGPARMFKDLLAKSMYFEAGGAAGGSGAGGGGGGRKT